MKLVIADDDALIIQGLAKYISSLDASYEIVGTAYNGQQALELVHTTNPDLLISDVKMPIMDGLELIRALRGESNKIRVLMLSGYNDYDYLRESMKANALDYLLKPIDLDELSRILCAIEKDLNTQKQVSREVGEKSQNSHNAQRLLEHLQTVGKGLKIKGMSDCATHFVFIFSLDSLPKNFTMMAEPAVLENVLTKELLWEFFGQFEGVTYVACNVKNELVLLLEIKGEDAKAQTLAISYGTSLRSLFADYSLLPVTGAMSAAFSRVSEAATQFQVTSDLLLQRLYRGGNQMLLSHQGVNFVNDVDINAFTQRVDKVTHHIMTCDIPILKKSVFEVIDFLQASQVHPNVFYHSLCDMVNSIYGVLPGLREICVDVSDFNDCIKQSITNAKDIISIKNIFTDILIQKILEYREGCQHHNTQFIELSKKYMRENYMNQISLNDVAENVHLNYSYLSELFKEKTGMNFTEHLIGMRMKEAKRLLAQPQIKIYEIAYLVGYMDAASFTRAFKKHTGISPAEYRDVLS